MRQKKVLVRQVGHPTTKLRALRTLTVPSSHLVNALAAGFTAAQLAAVDSKAAPGASNAVPGQATDREKGV